MFATLDAVGGARARSQQAIVERRCVRRSSASPASWPSRSSPPALGTSFGATPVSLVIQGPDVPSSRATRRDRRAAPASSPGFVNVRSDLFLNKPQLDVDDRPRPRQRPRRLGARRSRATLQILLGGLDLSTFKLEGETYNVMAQLEQASSAATRATSSSSTCAATSDELIPLASVVARAGDDRAARPAALRPPALGDDLGDVSRRGVAARRGARPASRRIAERGAAATGAGLPLTFSGESEEFFESGNALAFAYLLAVVIIYLVLAAQFESFVHP